MKNQSLCIVTFIVAISLVFCFLGCKQSVEPTPAYTDEKTDNDESGTKPNSIGFKILLPAGNVNRAGYYSVEDVESYVVIVKDKESGELVEDRRGRPGETVTITVKQEGEYFIEVIAYNSEYTQIASGSAYKSITFDDGYVSVVIKLIPNQKPSDPSDPSVTKSIDIAIDIQWVSPKVLTLETTSDSCFRRSSDNADLGKTVSLEFLSGMTLSQIFESNDVHFSLSPYDIDGIPYEFYGCFIDADGYRYRETSILTEDITLSPVFLPTPQVTFDLNGGNIDGDTSDKVGYTNWISKSYPYQPVKDNLIFVGWTLTQDGEDFITEVEEDIIVYAKYIEPQSCILTVTTNEHTSFYNYDKGEYVGTSLTFEFMSGMTLYEIFEAQSIRFWPDPEEYLTVDGTYWFYGYLDAEQNEYDVESVLLKDLELTAFFMREPTITFNLNGGNIDGDTSDVIITDWINAIPKKEGYVFDSWTLTLDGESIFSEAGECLNEELFEKILLNGEDFTLYAKWTAV